MKYGISYGNGNDGLSRMYPSFTVDAPEGSEFLLARLGMISNFKGSTRRYVAREIQTDEAGENSAQSVIYDPPGRDGRGYSEHNGAWRLCEAFPADEFQSDRSEAPHFESMAEAFGARMIAAHKAHA